MFKNSLFLFLFAFVLIFSGCQNSGTIDYPVSKLFLDTLPTENDSILRINTMKEDLKHGESYLYFHGYGSKRWDLYIRDSLLISQNCDTYKALYGCTFWYYNSKDSTLYPMGSVVYDYNTNERIDSISNYIEVTARDTIYWGDPYWIKVTGIPRNKSDFNITLRLGDITPEFKLDNEYASFESETNEILFQISDYKLGINLLTGLVYYYKNGENVTHQHSLSEIEFPFVFFKQFVVLKPD